MTQWVSTKDKKPEEGVDVLCYWRIMGPEEMHVLTYYPPEERWYRQCDHSDDNDRGWAEPDLWMPLPKVPDEDKP